ncbi:transporter substrate-binding domain-containing protein [Pseudomonadota bacterium]
MGTSRCYKIIQLLVGFLFIFSSDLFAAAQDDLELSDTERQWLSEHPTIRVAPDPDFAPVEWISSDGQYLGIAADYLRLIEARLGIEFKVVRAKDWPSVIDKARNRQVDVLTAAATTPERARFLVFTKPHIVLPGVILSSKSYKSIEGLSGRKVAVVSGYLWDESLTSQKTGVRIIRVEDTKTGIELAAMGAVDAMISDLATATNTIREQGITNLRIVSHLDRKMELSYAVRNDWTVLRSILDKALASVTQQQRDVISARWLNLESPSLWANRTLWYIVLGSMGTIILLSAGFFTWNRMLKKQVDQRTRDLQQAHMQLMQAEKMESVGRLAAGVAHEVKNPLAIIQMGSDFLAAEYGKEEIAGEVIGDINDAVRRADSVILGLLDFSRDKKLEMKSGAINEVIESSLRLVGHEMRQRNIEVNVNLEEGLPDIEMDVNRLQQVFINVFMNAAHAMERNGELGVSSRLSILDNQLLLKRDSSGKFNSGDQVLSVEVVDTGPGISKENVQKLFEPFFTTKPVGEGTGLGLSVSRNIIHLHHGSMDLSNRDSIGASILFMFQINPGAIS